MHAVPDDRAGVAVTRSGGPPCRTAMETLFSKGLRRPAVCLPLFDEGTALFSGVGRIEMVQTDVQVSPNATHLTHEIG